MLEPFYFISGDFFFPENHWVRFYAFIQRNQIFGDFFFFPENAFEEKLGETSSLNNVSKMCF
jgi:hypothetical protein